MQPLPDRRCSGCNKPLFVTQWPLRLVNKDEMVIFSADDYVVVVTCHRCHTVNRLEMPPTEPDIISVRRTYSITVDIETTEDLL